MNNDNNVVWTDNNGISSLSYIDTKEEFDAFVKTIPDTWDIYDDFSMAVNAFKQKFINWDKRGG